MFQKTFSRQNEENKIKCICLWFYCWLWCYCSWWEEWKVRPEIININSNEPSFYDVKINKCSGSYNNIYDPYAEMCIPDVIKNLNLKVFNLMPRTNETRHIKFHETCKCTCRLDASVCNKKQRWNEDKCRCEYKELIDKGVCDKAFIWNASNC